MKKYDESHPECVLTKIVSHPEDHDVFSYLRKHTEDEVLVVVNCSNSPKNFVVKDVKGVFRNIFGGPDIEFKNENSVYLKEWGFLLFEKVKILS